MTEPGRAILSQPIRALGSNMYFYIIYIPIKVPVLPRPALQCTAMALPPYFISDSHILTNVYITAYNK